jgi:hypothetical protein
MGWGAINVAAAATGGLIEAYGQKRQGRAYKDAADREGQYQARLTVLQEQMWKEAKRLMELGMPLKEALREASLKSVNLLSEDITRKPGESLLYKQALEKGTKDIFSGLAPYGLTDSSVSGVAVGELGTGLLAQEEAQIRNARFRLAGMAPDDTGAALSLYTLGSNLAVGQGSSVARQGSYITGRGATEAAMYGGLGRTVAGLPEAFWQGQTGFQNTKNQGKTGFQNTKN